jgi:ArsR family transcriptional regulator
MHELGQNIRTAFSNNRALFIALGDKYRQEILLLLGENEKLTVYELSEKLGISRSTTSHHIKILKDAGLLESNKVGVNIYYFPTLFNASLCLIALTDALKAYDQEHGVTEGNNG